MKIIALSSLLFLLAVPIGASCETEYGTNFYAWAAGSSHECDKTWNLLVARETGLAIGGAERRMPLATIANAYNKESFSKRAKLDFCSSSGLMHKGVRNQRLFPMSTRKRSDPSRGASKFENLASSHLRSSFDRLRPLNSEVQQRKPFESFASPTRPKLNQSGRLSKSAHRKSISHPGSRPDRPRLF